MISNKDLLALCEELFEQSKQRRNDFNESDSCLLVEYGFSLALERIMLEVERRFAE